MGNTKSLPKIAPKKDDPQYFIEDKNIALLLIKKNKTIIANEFKEYFFQCRK